jgi:hypothetical protein
MPSIQTGDEMVGYRCYILDAEDHIVQAHDVECDTDAQVESAAEDLLGQDPYHSAVEIWRAAHRIGKLERSRADRGAGAPAWAAAGPGGSPRPERQIPRR